MIIILIIIIVIVILLVVVPYIPPPRVRHPGITGVGGVPWFPCRPPSSPGKFHDIWKFHAPHANLQQQQQSARVPNNAARGAATCSG